MIQPGALPRWRARRVVECIEEHLDERITITSLARECGLSSSHFSRAFKATFGVTVHLYVMQRRVQIARALILRTSDPLSEIAIRCGLSDQAHLTRWFRRVVGVTPAVWRRTHSEITSARESSGPEARSDLLA